MVFNFTKVEQILFSLLRMALHGTVENGLDWKSITEEEWKSCYKLAASHGVMAVAWDGIQCIESEKVLPRSLKIAWGIAVQNYEERYEELKGWDYRLVSRFLHTAREGISIFIPTRPIMNATVIRKPTIRPMRLCETWE